MPTVHIDLFALEKQSDQRADLFQVSHTDGLPCFTDSRSTASCKQWAPCKSSLHTLGTLYRERSTRMQLPATTKDPNGWWTAVFQGAHLLEDLNDLDLIHAQVPNGRREGRGGIDDFEGRDLGCLQSRRWASWRLMMRERTTIAKLYRAAMPSSPPGHR